MKNKLFAEQMHNINQATIEYLKCFDNLHYGTITDDELMRVNGWMRMVIVNAQKIITIALSQIGNNEQACLMCGNKNITVHIGDNR